MSTQNVYDKLFNVKSWKSMADISKKRKTATEIGQYIQSISHIQKRIFLCGVPTHNSLGDQIQCYCTKLWCQDNYPNHYLVSLPTWVFHDKSFQKIIKEEVYRNDIIIVLGGCLTEDADENFLMHQYLVKNFHHVPILFMPQTLHSSKKAMKLGSLLKNHPKVLFLTRDKESFDLSKKYFPEVSGHLYPDILLSLVGQRKVSKDKKGILLCIEESSNKKEALLLQEFLSKENILSDISDIHIPSPTDALLMHLKKEFQSMLKRFEQYEVIITDSYYGIVFSLIANRPVIALTDNNKKRKFGIEWFEWVYEDSFFCVAHFKEAKEKAMCLLKEEKDIQNPSYFRENYYNHLKALFEKIRK